jgi:hypothetical protein
MKPHFMKILIVLSIVILFGTGYAWAGGRTPYSHPSKGSHYRGYHQKGNAWGYKHHWPKHHYRYDYDRGPRYYPYRHYGPPPRYYYYNHYYPGDWGRYDGAYYFSGGYSEPGFGFVFGTRGNW